ncbi:hypothetical protein SAMN02800692_3110 [Luteibacter sp. UNC138MFCol5.1]|nr:hypothetical protein SAMN02800692_3110 [Luteibacter sp. UNC138MFCol5.1]
MNYRIIIGMFAIAFASGAVASDLLSRAEERVNVMTAAIRSKDQLHAHLSSDPTSPLLALEPSKRKSFVESLLFTDAGLASYSFLELEGLPSTSIYRILTLFGVQADTADIRRSVGFEDAEVENILKRYSQRPRDNLHRMCVISPHRPTRCVPNTGSRCPAGCGVEGQDPR